MRRIPCLSHLRALAACLLMLSLQPAIGLTDTLIVTHEDNPTNSLTLKEVRKIFLGRLGMYPGTSSEPHPLDFPQDSTQFEQFYESVIGMPPAKIKRYRAYYLFSGKGKIPTEMPDTASILKALENDPSAIAYLPDTPKNSNLKVLLRIKQAVKSGQNPTNTESGPKMGNAESTP